METQPDLDDAIDVALDRTLDAQAELRQSLGADAVPGPALADRVVRRAEDLHALADDSVVLANEERADRKVGSSD